MATETVLPSPIELHPFICELCGKQLNDTIIATERYPHDRMKPYRNCISYTPAWAEEEDE